MKSGFSLQAQPFQPIAYGFSKPADPDAPSLLTTLPGELRNLVYDFLFNEVGGIKANPLAANPVPSVLSEYPENRDFVTETLYETGVPTELWDMFEDETLRKDLASSLSLLRTCRQMYHEGGTRLFSGNTWVVSKRLPPQFDDTDAFPGMIKQLSGAAWMLSSFGTLAEMLRRIVINLDESCPVNCPGHSELVGLDDYDGFEHAMPVLDLVRQMRRHTQLKIEFVLPNSTAQHQDQIPESLRLVPSIKPEVLSTVLQTLQQDPLKLGSYRRQLAEIYIQRDGSAGLVMLQNPRNPRSTTNDAGQAQRRFTITDGGKTFTWTPETKNLSLLGMPLTIRTLIMDPVVLQDSSTPVIWDLDNKTTGPAFQAANICQELRYWFQSKFWTDNRHRLIMSTCDIRTDFDQFAPFDQFWEVDEYMVPDLDQMELVLQFKVGAEVALEDLQVDLAPLLRITANIIHGTNKVTVAILNTESVIVAQTSKSIDQCREIGLLALPAHLKPVEHFDRRLQYPPIWMNGHLELVHLDGINLDKLPYKPRAPLN
jgi:hypothetical protein